VSSRRVCCCCWSIPSPLQAKWLLFARSARLCTAGGGRRRPAV